MISGSRHIYSDRPFLSFGFKVISFLIRIIEVFLNSVFNQLSGVLIWISIVNRAREVRSIIIIKFQKVSPTWSNKMLRWSIPDQVHRNALTVKRFYQMSLRIGLAPSRISFNISLSIVSRLILFWLIFYSLNVGASNGINKSGLCQISAQREEVFDAKVCLQIHQCAQIWWAFGQKHLSKVSNRSTSDAVSSGWIS